LVIDDNEVAGWTTELPGQFCFYYATLKCHMACRKARLIKKHPTGMSPHAGVSMIFSMECWLAPLCVAERKTISTTELCGFFFYQFFIYV